MRPAKGSPEYALWIAAIEVAVAPPRTDASGQATAQVPWRRIKELRAALEAVGIDWETAWTKDVLRRPRMSR